MLINDSHIKLIDGPCEDNTLLLHHTYIFVLMFHEVFHSILSVNIHEATCQIILAVNAKETNEIIPIPEW